jgi:hypothetical protein
MVLFLGRVDELTAEETVVSQVALVPDLSGILSWRVASCQVRNLGYERISTSSSTPPKNNNPPLSVSGVEGIITECNLHVNFGFAQRLEIWYNYATPLAQIEVVT